MSKEVKKCPYCAEEISNDAIKCKHCGEFLNQIKSEEKETSSSLGNIGYFVVGVLLFIMAFTNPSEDKHYIAVKQQFATELNNQNNAFSSLLSLGLNLSADEEFAQLAKQFIEVNNYLLFSTSSFKKSGKEGGIIGIGVFGKVFLLDEETKKVNEEKQTNTQSIENSGSRNQLQNEFLKWKSELIQKGILLEKCYADYKIWLKKSESNPNLPTFAFVDPTVNYSDINNDSQEDALYFFTPEECDGGNASIDQSDYAVLIYSKDGQYLLNDKLINTIQEKTQEFIQNKSAIKLENTVIGISKLDNYKIIGSVRSWKSDDGHCCPFFSDSFSFDLTTNQLSFDHQFIPPSIENTATKDESDNDNASYFVITSEKAYFYNEPDNSTIRKAYLINGQRFMGEKSENNFVYAVFSNSAGKETKGWIKTSDIRKEN